MRRLFQWAACFVALLSGGQGAFAACFISPESSRQSIDMYIGTVVVPEGASIGTKLAERSFPIDSAPGGREAFRCPLGRAPLGTPLGNLRGSMLQGSEVSVPGVDGVYSTNVPGIGVRLLRNVAQFDGSIRTTTYPHTIPIAADRDFRTNQYVPVKLYPGSSFVIQIYKTAVVTGSGPLAAGLYTQYSGDGDGTAALTTTLSANAVTIVTPTCSVDPGSVYKEVPLGKVPLRTFKGRGTTTNERAFDLTLNCRKGVGVPNTIQMWMDATRDPAGDPGVLRITGGGATGVGIQVRDRQGNPVKFRSEGGSPMDLGPSPEGPLIVPFTARYFQTAGSVTAGRADGTATFTIEYK